MSADARKKWEAENKIESADIESLYKYDNKKYQEALSQRPWKNE